MKDLMKKWKIFLEVLAPEKEQGEYEKIISQAEKAAGINSAPEKSSTSKKITGSIKSSCRCVDRSESSLSVSQIKKIINNYYNSRGGSPFGKLDTSETCDNKTKKAIMQFQADTGIEQDGCVGDETEGAMVKVGLLKSLTKVSGFNSLSTSKIEPSSNFDPSAVPTSGGSGGSVKVTVIKSNVPGPSPHSRVVKTNFQGYGRDTASAGNTSNDAYFINGINVADALSGSPGIKIRAGRRQRQFGTELLANALRDAAAAADAVGKQLKRSGGETVLSDVSLGRCFNARQRRKDPSLPCIQGGWGPGLGSWRWGHQSGLEADLSYFKKKGSAQAGWKPTQVGYGNFDFERNCAFLNSLLNHPRMEMVLLSKKVATKMQEWVRQQSDEIKNEYSAILSSPKIGYDRKTGHDDHYHVRMMIPDNAMNMRQFKASLKNKKNTVSSTNYSAPTTGSRRFRSLASKSLEQIKRIYPNTNQFSYTLGTIDGRIIEQYNQDTLFYGASMPKTMLGLVHLLSFKGNARLRDSELKNMLVYDRGSNQSNVVARGISSRFSGSTKRLRRRGLGKVTPQQVRNVSKNFGINKSTFQFGGGMNRQTSKESFLFFAGLARMEQNKFNANDPLEKFYRQNKNEIDKLIFTQKQRIGSYSRNMTPSGIYNRKIKAWGKGGRYNGALNFVWVVDEKYVISVFSQVRPRAAKGPKRQSIDAEGYDVLNSVIYNLLQKIDSMR